MVLTDLWGACPARPAPQDAEARGASRGGGGAAEGRRLSSPAPRGERGQSSWRNRRSQATGALAGGSLFHVHCLPFEGSGDGSRQKHASFGDPVIISSPYFSQTGLQIDSNVFGSFPGSFRKSLPPLASPCLSADGPLAMGWGVWPPLWASVTGGWAPRGGQRCGRVGASQRQQGGASLGLWRLEPCLGETGLSAALHAAISKPGQSGDEEGARARLAPR